MSRLGNRSRRDHEWEKSSSIQKGNSLIFVMSFVEHIYDLLYVKHGNRLLKTAMGISIRLES